METWQRAEIPTFRVNVREIKQLEKNHTKAIRQALARIFTLANLPYYFLGFLLGRACMLGDSFPFGIAYLTYLLGTGPKGRLYATGAAVFLGIFSYYPGLWALDYAVIPLLLFLGQAPAFIRAYADEKAAAGGTGCSIFRARER